MKATIWLIAFLVFSCFSTQDENAIEDKSADPGKNAGKGPEALKEAYHPLSIRGMRARVDLISGFTLEQERPETKTYSSSVVSFTGNGIRQYAEISKPKQEQPAAGYPVILLLHGYIPPPSYSTTRSYSILFRRYATSEFVVVKPDYQGHGRSERQANFERPLSTIFYTNDVLQVLTSLRSLDYVDMDNIFVMGHSMGGEIALRLAVVYPNIKAISLWGPVTTLRENVNFFYGGQKFGHGALSLPEALPLIEAEHQKIQDALKRLGMKSIADIRYLDALSEIRAPLMIQHPDTDESVPYAWSLQFKERYDALPNNPSLKLINYPGDDHNISKNQRRAQNVDLEWFRSLL